MPEADFCSAVRSPYGHLSRRSDTEQISWGKFSHFPCTVAESTFRTLMDMDFAVSRPLVRYGRLLFGFCPSTRTFVPCFLQTPPHGGSPCIITSPFLHQDGQRTFTSWLLNMPSTRLSRWRGGRFACTSFHTPWTRLGPSIRHRSVSSRLRVGNGPSRRFVMLFSKRKCGILLWETKRTAPMQRLRP
jgi:hypothetical protein